MFILFLYHLSEIVLRAGSCPEVLRHVQMRTHTAFVVSLPISGWADKGVAHTVVQGFSVFFDAVETVIGGIHHFGVWDYLTDI